MQDQQTIPVQQGLYDFISADMSDLKLLGSACQDCGEKHFPPKAICPHCSSRQLEKVFLSATGTIDTFTVVRQASPLWRGPVPYIIVIVMLDDGVKVTSHLIECDPEKVIIGGRVEVTAGKLRDDEDGRAVTAHMFKPIK